jgi:leucyl/phenylalanyl-tRNA--protein transferase
MPIEPPRSAWRFPAPGTWGPDELVALGADLAPGTLLAAYRLGIFPMPLPAELVPELAAHGPLPMAWWSSDPRGLLPLDGLRVSTSLRRACRRFEIRVDTAFDEVVAACADPSRPGGWIDDAVVAGYRQLFELGWAHSVEAWSPDHGTLAGGLYGVAIGGLFAGESMFHRRTDASKVALVGLTHLLRARGFTLHDVQWLTPHLATLGAVTVPRAVYLQRLAQALAVEPEPLGPLAEPLRF